MENQIYLTVEKVMIKLNVSRRTVYYYCQKGYLQYTKPAGKRIYITLESVNLFFSQRSYSSHSFCTTDTQRRNI